MRIIKFRGKSLATREWLYGYYVVIAGYGNVIPDGCGQFEYSLVDTTTVGQFTGLTDKNGKEIFEGDLLKSESWLCNCEVIWMYGGFTIKEGDTASNLEGNFVDDGGYLLEDIEVIGNIHDKAEQ